MALIVLIVALGLTSVYQAVASRQDAITFPPPGKLLDVGGYRLHINCTGQRVDGSPAVVFEGGLGASSIMWSMVQGRIAPYTRACSYDRAGYGWSDPAPQPRTARQIAVELHALLVAAREPPPYILVGHSFGGIIIRMFAVQYPSEASALVLVDARHEDFFRQMPPAFLQVDEANFQKAKVLEVITPLGLTRLAGQVGLLDSFESYLSPLPEKAKAAAIALMIYNTRHWQTAVAERELIEASFDQVRASRLPPDLRVTVLTAANGVEAWQPPDSNIDAQTRNAWVSLQRQLAMLTARSAWVVVANSGHYIQLDRPDAVADAILRAGVVLTF